MRAPIAMPASGMVSDSRASAARTAQAEIAGLAVTACAAQKGPASSAGISQLRMPMRHSHVSTQRPLPR